MPSIKQIFLFATVAAAALIRRDFATAQADLRLLYIAENRVLTTSKQVDPNNSDSNGASIQAGYQLYQNFSKATTTLNNTAVFTDAQASTYFSNLTNTLYPGLKNALNAVVGAKKNYNSAGKAFEPAVLTELSKSVTNYGGAVVTRVPTASQASAMAISGSFSALVSSAYSAFKAA